MAGALIAIAVFRHVLSRAVNYAAGLLGLEQFDACAVADHPDALVRVLAASKVELLVSLSTVLGMSINKRPSGWFGTSFSKRWS